MLTAKQQELYTELQESLSGHIVEKADVDTSRITLKVNSEKKVLIFTSFYLFGYQKLSEDWVSCSTQLPRRVVPRPSCPDGLITTIDKFLEIFYKDFVVIETLEDLVRLELPE